MTATVTVILICPAVHIIKMILEGEGDAQSTTHKVRQASFTRCAKVSWFWLWVHILR